MSINLKKSTTFWNANGSENMPHSNVKDLQTLNENLNWYAQQVVNAKRDIEYWDVYRFDGSVDSKEDFDSKYAALPNNHALVVNVDIDKYQTGDVIIKDNNGEQILVKSKQNGVFKPDTYDKNKKTLTYIYAIAIYSIYKSSKIRHRIVLSILLCAIYIVIIFTGQSSISRWYTVVTISASIAVFFKLYPNYRKSIAISLVVPGVVLMVAATIIKNTTIGYGAGFDTTMESIFDVNLMDIYFAGPVSVNSGIGASERFDIGLSSMFYDILNNFPILGNYIDRENASVALFGKYNGRGDLIIPLVVQSCCWFGKLGMGILSALSVVFVKKTDLKFKYSISPISYVFAFVSIWTGIITILNFTIWISWFYSMIIPTFILFYVSKRINN